VKSNLLRACVVKGLEAFLKKNLDYDFYQDYAEDLTTTFRELFRKNRTKALLILWRWIVHKINRKLFAKQITF
jgi:hypothetical protein